MPYSALYDWSAPPQPMTDHAIGEFLRCSTGLSAWKRHGQSRWALRVNPSSGNLHPTEAWIVHRDRVYHYAPLEHALEERCLFDSRVAPQSDVASPEFFLVALTSITWREAWKYGARAFRYCQHDAGHAIGALRLAAAMLGWRMRLLTQWSDTQIASLLGLDRDGDYDGAEREEPECIAVVTRDSGLGIRDSGFDPESLVAQVKQGTWHGHANQLSPSHVDWPIIDEVMSATRYPGVEDQGSGIRNQRSDPRTLESRIPNPESRGPSARDIILQRRSALSFNPRGVLERAAFFAMLDRLQIGSAPWDVIDWPPHVHLVLFVHRVRDVTPGVYAYLRDPGVLDEWKAAMRPEFLWEPANVLTGPLSPGNSEPTNLFLLLPIEAGRIANRLSCDQDIAEDGCFSLAMLARFEPALRERGEWFYRRLFWEAGLIGQVLYLEAEAVGVRATGIGCYYDEPVHELLGLSGRAWQSLYHFSMGHPIEDGRLTSEPGYQWER